MINELKACDGIDGKVFDAAFKAWRDWDVLREKRRRTKDFTYGSQWNDKVRDSSGRLMREYDKVAESGKEPLTNNVIRRLVRSVVGRFRNFVPKASADLEKCYEDNSLNEIDSRMLEEFLISGCCLQRVDVSDDGVTVDNLNMNRFFSNSIEDVRGNDCTIVGYLHDCDVGWLIKRLAYGDRGLACRIRNIYEGRCDSVMDERMTVGMDNERYGGFLHAKGGLCRAIEVWTLEMTEVLECHDRITAEFYTLDTSCLQDVEAENKYRSSSGLSLIDVGWGVKETWHCRWFAPCGEVLTHYVSPYKHGSHPFVMKLYPLTDGEVHSFVEDVIDQQKYVNRLITLIDHIMGASAKGVLLYPDTALPEGFTWRDVKRIWSSTNGIIPYSEGCNGVMPHQVSTNATDIGAYELLSLQMQLIEEISGVGSVLQGKSASNKGVQMYERQVENASISLADIFETFYDFRRSRDAKMKSCLHADEND